MRVGSFFKGTLRESSAHPLYSGDLDKDQLGPVVVPRELNAVGIHELNHVAFQLYLVISWILLALSMTLSFLPSSCLRKRLPFSLNQLLLSYLRLKICLGLSLT
jgi:hypothetical protein